MAKIKMEVTDTKTVKVYPKTYRYIADILENMKRIEEPMELELNVKEITRAMSNAVVTEVAEDGTETVLNTLTFNLKEEEAEGDDTSGASVKEEATEEKKEELEP